MVGGGAYLSISKVLCSLSRWALFHRDPTCIGKGGEGRKAFPGLVWSVWALSEWFGTAADPISPVIVSGFVTCRAGGGGEHACELGTINESRCPITWLHGSHLTQTHCARYVPAMFMWYRFCTCSLGRPSASPDAQRPGGTSAGLLLFPRPAGWP